MIEKQEYLEQRDKLHEGLTRLETQLGRGPYFNGEQIALTDTAYAPLSMHIDAANTVHPLVDYENTPKVGRWSDVLPELAAVRGSVIPDFHAVYQESLAEGSSYYGELARSKG